MIVDRINLYFCQIFIWVGLLFLYINNNIKTFRMIPYTRMSTLMQRNIFKSAFENILTTV